MVRRSSCSSRRWLSAALLCRLWGACAGGTYRPVNSLYTNDETYNSMPYWKATATGTLSTDTLAYFAKDNCQIQGGGCPYVFNFPNSTRNNFTAPLGQFRRTPVVRGAGCSFVSFSSDYAVIDAFMASENGLLNAFEPSLRGANDVVTGGWDLQDIATMNETYSRTGSWLYGLNTTGAYSYVMYNAGGRSASAPLSSVQNTNLKYAFTAYAPSEPICDSARPVGGGAFNMETESEVEEGADGNETLTVTIERTLGFPQLAPMAAFTNASCISYQLLAQPPAASPLPGTTTDYGAYYTFNSSSGAYLRDSDLTRGVFVFLVEQSAAQNWYQENIQGTPVRTLGAVCSQGVSANPPNQDRTAGLVFSSNSSDTRATAAVPNSDGTIYVQPTQTCYAVVNGLDPSKNYILFGSNDPQQTITSPIAKLDIRIAARSTGNCSGLVFPDVTDTGAGSGSIGMVGLLPQNATVTDAYTQQPSAIPDASPNASAPYVYGVQQTAALASAPPASTGSSNAGAIAGGVVGGVAGLAVLTVGLLLCTGRWKPFQKPSKVDKDGQREDQFFGGRFSQNSSQPRWTEVADFSTIITTDEHYSEKGATTTESHSLYRTSDTGVDTGPSSIHTLPSPAHPVTTINFSEGSHQHTAPLGTAAAPATKPSWREKAPSDFSKRPSGTPLPPVAAIPPWSPGNTPEHSREGTEVSAQGAAGGHVHTIDFSVAKETFKIDPGQLQAAKPDVITTATTAFHASEASAASAAPSHSTEGGGGLDDTWKLDAKHLKCKVSGGKPIILGEGGFGKVYLGELFGSQDVAVKVVQSKNEQHRANFIQEIHTLKACFNPHIVQFIGAIFSGPDIFLVMEFMPGKNLFGLLESGNSAQFGWYKLGKHIMLDIAKGVVYLHSIGIIHFDIKSPNVLLTGNYQAKLADIGLGKFLAGDGSLTAKAKSGTLYWSAPEQKLGEDCSFSADIFSLGVVLWEVCTQLPPTPNHRRAVRPDEAPQAIIDLIRSTAFPAAERPTAVEFHNIIQKAIEDGL